MEQSLLTFCDCNWGNRYAFYVQIKFVDVNDIRTGEYTDGTSDEK